MSHIQTETQISQSVAYAPNSEPVCSECGRELSKHRHPKDSMRMNSKWYAPECWNLKVERDIHARACAAARDLRARIRQPWVSPVPSRDPGLALHLRDANAPSPLLVTAQPPLFRPALLVGLAAGALLAARWML